MSKSEIDISKDNKIKYQKLEKTIGVDIEVNMKDEKYLNKISDKVIVGKYSEAPDYLKDNEYIKNGYLLNCHTIKLVLRSLFVCSNETINVWSHLIGCIISITLIILLSILVKSSISKELTENEYNDLKMKVNETIAPLLSELYNYKLSKEDTFNENVSSIIDIILSNTENFISDYGTKFTIINIIENFVERIKVLINSILNNYSKIKYTFTFNKFKEKWEKWVNKTYSYIQNENNININSQNIKKWPLFIMLSASIVCFGFSTSFHWFSIYDQRVYSILSRLDYAGITFLIPGSCYPPYFYFYYCEKC